MAAPSAALADVARVTCPVHIGHVARFEHLRRTAVDSPEAGATSSNNPWANVGNGTMARLFARRQPDRPQEETSGAGSVPQVRDAVAVWFPVNSAEPLRENGAQLVQTAAGAVKTHLARNKGAKVTVAGYASEEGSQEHNMSLSARRAARIKALLVQAGVPAEQLVDIGRGVSKQWQRRDLNRRVDVEVEYDSSPPDKTEISPDARPDRQYRPSEKDALHHLAYLYDVSKKQGTAGAEFAAVLNEFRIDLDQRMSGLKEGPLPADLQIVMKALALWHHDNGTTWGEGPFDSTDRTSSYAEYAVVRSWSSKCNIYVAEVLYLAVGTVHKVHAADHDEGKWLPTQAREWADTARLIPKYPVVTDPKMGDVWSNGTHTGIFLGNYKGTPLYISARDDGDGVFGQDKAQHTHGIQIKVAPSGGVFRRYKR